MDLKDFFEKNKEVAVAFSGGVDSCYLLVEALKYARRISAYFVCNNLQSEYEKNDALKIAKEIGCELKIINIDALSRQRIRENSPKRCYYCKRMIFENIIESAKKDGFSVVLEGTNASDDVEDRPGFKALSELGVKSPLRECGITKAEVRKRLCKSGFYFWDKPSSACLATRIPFGSELTDEKLFRVQRAEDALRDLGFRDFRVRELALKDDSQRAAKIQIRDEDFLLLCDKRAEIKEALSALYDIILCDLEGR